MQEIEALFYLKMPFNEIIKKLHDIKESEFKGSLQTIDEYFQDAKRVDLQPDETGKTYKSFRLRKNQKPHI